MFRLLTGVSRYLVRTNRIYCQASILNRIHPQSVAGCCDARRFHSFDFQSSHDKSENPSSSQRRQRRQHSGDQKRHRSQYNWNGNVGTSIFFLPAFSFWSDFKYTFGLGKPNSEEKIQEMIRNAAASVREENFEDALRILHEALFKSEEDKNDNAINYCLDMMANIYYFVGNYDAAIQTFTTLMQRMMAKEGKTEEGSTTTTSPAFVELSLKLADIYALIGDDDKAVSGFEFCVATQKANVEKEIGDHKRKRMRVPGPTRHDKQEDPESTDPYALYGIVLETYARYLVRKGRVEESQAYVNRALEMALEIFGSSHPHVLAVMNNFAILCISQRQYEVAEKYLKQVVTKAPLSEDGARHITGYYTNYAEVLWHLGRHDEALEYAQKAAKLANDARISEEDRRSAQAYLKSVEADYKKLSKKKGK